MGPRSAGLGRELSARMASVVPGGVNSNVRLEVADTFFARAEGARLWDVDGRDYVDYVLGQGPAFLGHAHPHVVKTVADTAAHGITFGAQTEVELRAAEAVVRALGWPDMARIGMTSTESVQAALRVARASTGRRLFLRFRGQYHGWLDNVLVDPSSEVPAPVSDGQLPEELEQSVTVEWNDLEVVADAFNRHPEQIAAVITEPMMCNSGAIEPEPGFLEGLRALCDEHGVVLIFDETITGFRIHPRGGAGRYDVVPDLAVYGKAVAGGFPASVIAGAESIMSRFASGTNHSGTFNANTVSCAAIGAAIEVMEGGSVHARVGETGARLTARLCELFAKHHLPLRVRGLPMAFHVSFDESTEPIRSYADLLRVDGARYRTLVRAATEAGLWLAGRGIWYVSAAHDEETTSTTLERLGEALGRAEPLG